MRPAAEVVDDLGAVFTQVNRVEPEFLVQVLLDGEHPLNPSGLGRLSACGPRPWRKRSTGSGKRFQARPRGWRPGQASLRDGISGNAVAAWVPIRRLRTRPRSCSAGSDPSGSRGPEFPRVGSRCSWITPLPGSRRAVALAGTRSATTPCLAP